MEKKKGGRPTKFTREVKEKLFFAIRKGAPYEHACKYANISFELFNQWRNRGKAEEPGFVEFVDELKVAEAETSLVWLDKIDKAMNDGAWQAAAWKLERRYPKIYGRNAEDLRIGEVLSKQIAEILKGNQNNAKKLDSWSDEEQGCVTPRIESANWAENPNGKTC